MGRKKDPFWDYVDKVNDKVIKCKFCGDEFAGGASRIKGHLSGMGGKGIHACNRVPEEVQKAASSTFGGSNETPCGSVNPSSNMPSDSSRGKGVLEHADVLGHVQTAPFSIINNSNQSIIMGTVNPISLEVNCLGFNQTAMRDVNSSYAEVNCLNSNQSIMGNDLGGPEENPHISNLNITRNINSSDLSREKSITGRKKDRFWQYVDSGLYGKVRCKFCRHEFVGGASRIKWHLSKTEKMGVEICCNVPENVQKAAEDTSNKRPKKNIISSHLEDNFVDSNSISDSYKGNVELYPMPTSTDFIGEEFRRYIDKIWCWLMEEKPSVIGVCGMGGVGKSTLLKHIYNKLSGHVIWIDVQQDCSVLQLQKDIAKSCHLHLLERDGTMAGKLLDALKKIKRCIIILDNVWEHIDLERVGIPLTDTEVQVIIASRLFHVCQTMGCKKHILRMVPLSKYGIDGWRLFCKVHGEDESRLSREVTDIAKLWECDGLPLAIATLAQSLREKEDIIEWKYVLKNLKNSKKEQEDVKKDVFPLLVLSYKHLNDKFLQECFLCCAFLLEYKKYILIGREDLIIHLVDEGLIDRKNSLEAQMDEGHIILNKLINNNLLIEKDEGKIDFHSLVGGMAASIAEGMSEVCVVNYSEDLRELEKKWKENLRQVSLDIKEIPLGTSPWCPKLLTLLLHYNNSLKLIPKSFFIHMPSLKLLDLSYCGQIDHLPTSVSELESLTALLLCGCSSLKYVPSLSKLHKLERLDLSGTAIIELPLGLEKLINLRWLNLERIQEMIISSALVIPKLTNLQVLGIDMYMVIIDHLKSLKKLESIFFSFSDRNRFNAYVRGTANSQSRGLRNYHLQLQESKLFSYESWKGTVYSTNKTIRFSSIGNATSLLLPVDMNKLIIEKCEEWRSLCDVLSFDDRNKSKSPKILSCTITCCAALENAFCLNSCCSFCSSLRSIECLELQYLKGLSMLTLAPWAPFSSLRYLTVIECHSMKALLTDGMAGVLQNLETLYVSCCDAMEEIFSSEKNNERTDVEIEDYQLLEELLSSGMGTNYQEEQVADAMQIHHTHPTMIQLPKLKSVTLVGLQRLKRVYEGILACGSLQKFEISGCFNVKQLPQTQPLFQDFKICDCPYLQENSYALSNEELLISP